MLSIAEFRHLIKTWLAPYDPSQFYENSLNAFQKGTGEWFLDGVFQEWLDEHCPPILWLSAKREQSEHHRHYDLYYTICIDLSYISWCWKNDLNASLSLTRTTFNYLQALVIPAQLQSGTLISKVNLILLTEAWPISFAPLPITKHKILKTYLDLSWCNYVKHIQSYGKTLMMHTASRKKILGKNPKIWMFNNLEDLYFGAARSCQGPSYSWMQ